MKMAFCMCFKKKSTRKSTTDTNTMEMYENGKPSISMVPEITRTVLEFIEMIPIRPSDKRTPMTRSILRERFYTIHHSIQKLKVQPKDLKSIQNCLQTLTYIIEDIDDKAVTYAVDQLLRNREFLRTTLIHLRYLVFGDEECILLAEHKIKQLRTQYE